MKKTFISFLTIILLITPTLAITNKPVINATSAIAIDSNSFRILYEKNAFSKKPMASTTKIMTIIIAVENNNLDEIVTISKKAAGTGGSSAHLKAGKQIKLEELLYGLMLNSGNDAAVAIAEHTADSVENFAKLMNKKAIELGALNTNFVTPHGLDTNNHYSTAYDMAIIAAYALKNPIISEIVNTTSKDMKFTDGTSVFLSNTNKLLSLYNGANGVKTGYTAMAGRCLIGSATQNNWQVITVVFGEPTSSSRLNDTIKLLDYCFDNYSLVDLCELYTPQFKINIKKGKKINVTPKYANSLVLPLTKSEEKSITIKKSYSDELIAPIKQNQIIGKVDFMLNDVLLGSVKLLSSESVERLSYKDYYNILLDNFFEGKYLY
ncbi:MAG: D-alanyl-D-alanine carboxypeptidase [Clostridiales bacterium]|nr:D-alanyl-D-alanine carboxypeptidase [Clostridiales bacterium]